MCICVCMYVLISVRLYVLCVYFMNALSMHASTYVDMNLCAFVRSLVHNSVYLCKYVCMCSINAFDHEGESETKQKNKNLYLKVRPKPLVRTARPPTHGGHSVSRPDRLAAGLSAGTAPRPQAAPP